MKNKLDSYRKSLDKIDTKILNLFENRMEVVKNVAIYKEQNNLPTLDSSRERLMIEKNCNKLTNKNLEPYYKEILSAYLKVSKDYQNSLNKK